MRAQVPPLRNANSFGLAPTKHQQPNGSQAYVAIYGSDSVHAAKSA
ncbi:hypothetical protein SAMN05446635_7997 [Burkholderia sp. OK233]|nr:hypothetical protein SAMN05446635_7997 [Burkholderia sp. OK233]